MDAELLMSAFLHYAKRVARSMSRDPEMDSIAGEAAWYAARTYDGRIHVKRWIARITKQHVWCYWRSLRARPETLVENGWLEMRIEAPEPDEECSSVPFNLPQEDWQLLHDYYVLKHPLLVLARKYGGVSRVAIRERISAGVALLQETMDAES